nr:MAG TPA: hypothetical protein [Caudoviricetes sp.]
MVVTSFLVLGRHRYDGPIILVAASMMDVDRSISSTE